MFCSDPEAACHAYIESTYVCLQSTVIYISATMITLHHLTSLRSVCCNKYAELEQCMSGMFLTTVACAGCTTML